MRPHCLSVATQCLTHFQDWSPCPSWPLMAILTDSLKERAFFTNLPNCKKIARKFAPESQQKLKVNWRSWYHINVTTLHEERDETWQRGHLWHSAPSLCGVCDWLQRKCAPNKVPDAADDIENGGKTLVTSRAPLISLLRGRKDERRAPLPWWAVFRARVLSPPRYKIKKGERNPKPFSQYLRLRSQLLCSFRGILAMRSRKKLAAQYLRLCT